MTVMLVVLLERSCVDVVESKVAIVLGQHWCKLKAAREEKQAEEVSWCLEDKNSN